ncbi:MAG TPA: hypothetical protein VK767_11370 [Bradyrhizobium sp.]|nr:hypothetical protein [Bradyrhizobium sp.]
MTTFISTCVPYFRQARTGDLLSASTFLAATVAFIKPQNIAPGATSKTDGWPAYPGAPAPGGGEHEAGEGDGVVGEDQICRQHDQVEADNKEDRRRQDLVQLVQKSDARAAAEPAAGLVGVLGMASPVLFVSARTSVLLIADEKEQLRRKLLGFEGEQRVGVWDRLAKQQHAPTLAHIL